MVRYGLIRILGYREESVVKPLCFDVRETTFVIFSVLFVVVVVACRVRKEPNYRNNRPFGVESLSLNV